jgi:hypothetical protein
MKSFLVIVSLLCSAAFMHAQIASPTVGGITVHCTDAAGSTVYTTTTVISDSAMSSILPNGMRIIDLNPQIVPREPALLQLFTYAHECGHHTSGDIAMDVFFHHDNPQREMTADRIGIRLMRHQLGITFAQAQEIAQYFQNNPAVPPNYLPGLERAKWIVDCYKTNDDSCGNSSADYSKISPSQSDMCIALKKAIAESDHRFTAFRGGNCIDGNCNSTFRLPGADHCTIDRTKLFCRMSDDSDADDLSGQVKSCLRPLGWTCHDDREFDPPDDSGSSVSRFSISEPHGRINLTVLGQP